MVVVVTPSSVIDTSLTTALLEDEPPLREELCDAPSAGLVADDEAVTVVDEVAVVDDGAVVAWAETVERGELTELIDMGLSREEGPTARAARFAFSTQRERGAGATSCV
ncbi:hypothetical protein ACQR09_18520 [Bradyrhizobium oligotrophicum]|uniref:hypothetical protein n=1 Tax=Bradyrhizobium oligotrophicum TaxID=44255 RepID=UPI003EB85A72